MGFSNISELFPAMRTVYVRFDGTPNKMYAYLYHASLPLKQGDQVVVPTKGTFSIAEVVSTISGMTNTAHRLVYCKVCPEQHWAKEANLLKVLANVQELKKKADIGCNVSCVNDSYF